MAKRKPAAKKTEPKAAAAPSKKAAPKEKPPAPAKSKSPAAKKPAADTPSAKKASDPEPAAPPAKPRSKKPPQIPAWFQHEFHEMVELSALVTLIHEPDEKLTRAAYLDWLEDHSSPRGEFLRLWQQSQTLPSEMILARLNQLRSTLSPMWLCAMGDTLARVQPLVEKVHASNPDRGYQPELKVTSDWGLLDVHYSGDLLREELDPVLHWLVSRDVGPVVRSLRLNGPVASLFTLGGHESRSLVLGRHEDRGRRDGILEIDLQILANAELEFRHLLRLEIERLPGAIAVYNDASRENNLFARLLRKASQLRELLTPSAPSAEFFAGPQHPLEHLVVHAGNDHQGFVKNLAMSTRFPHLRSLEFQDYVEMSIDGWQSKTTPLAHYEMLFRALANSNVEKVLIRSVSLSRDDIKRLRAIRKTGVKFQDYEQGHFL